MTIGAQIGAIIHGAMYCIWHSMSKLRVSLNASHCILHVDETTIISMILYCLLSEVLLLQQRQCDLSLIYQILGPGHQTRI